MASIKDIPGGICAPLGFEAASAVCGIKSAHGPSKGYDLAIVKSVDPAACAAVFTSNMVQAAHIKLCRECLRNGRAQAVIINAGVANCLTGKQGYQDAVAATALGAELLGLKPADVLIWSTGVTGQFLPMAKIRKGIRAAAPKLSPTNGDAAALAIMTTDTHPKSVAVDIKIAGKSVRIGGMCKGAGMIAPNMATLLALVTTDAALPVPVLQKCLQHALRDSFNAITVDGDMSPNDTLMIMANGQSGVTPKAKDMQLFQAALDQICSCLAQMMVRDGEGATKFIAVSVGGAPSRAAAVQIGRAIANSSLVKCALHAGDPNWGRIMTSAGASGVRFDPDRAELHLAGIPVFKQGEPQRFSAARLHKLLSGSDIKIDLNLHAGSACATIYTCDLSEEYVTINADYHT
jgi:glutamate N-acetyltransferase / amino-acid N-acetyltransferase